MPMLPDGPGLFSMTIDVPSASPSFDEMIRATKSDAPPGANGTIILIGLFGYPVCPDASSEKRTRPSARAALEINFLIAPPTYRDSFGQYHPSRRPPRFRRGRVAGTRRRLT